MAGPRTNTQSRQEDLLNRLDKIVAGLRLVEINRELDEFGDIVEQVDPRIEKLLDLAIRDRRTLGLPTDA